MSKNIFDKTSFVPKGSYVYIEPAYDDSPKKLTNYSGFLVERNDNYIIITKNGKVMKHKIDECYYDYYYKVCESKKTKIIRHVKETFLSKDIDIKNNELTTENLLFETENIINKYNGKY